jgi:Ca2+/Na+ antiporter
VIGMSDQDPLEGMYDPPETVHVGNVVNNGGASEPAWQPQTESPTQQAAKTKRPRPTASLRQGFMSLLQKQQSRKPSSSRTHAVPQPSAPVATPASNGPRKGVVIGRKLLAGSQSTGSFVRNALVELNFFDTMLAVIFLVIYNAAYQETKPQRGDILIGMVGGSIAIGLLLLLSHTVYRLSSQSGRRTFVRMTGAAILVLLAIAIIASVYVYYPLYVPGMMIVAVLLLLFAGPFAWANARQEREAEKSRQAAERQAFEATCRTQAEEAANAKVVGILAEARQQLEQSRSVLDVANSNQEKANTALGQWATVAPYLNETIKGAGDILAGLKVKNNEVEEAIKGRLAKERESHIEEWTQTAKSHFAAHTQQQIDAAVAENQQANDGKIALRDQDIQSLNAQIGELSANFASLRASHAQLQQAYGEVEQQLTETEALNQQLVDENNSLQREQQRLRQEASYGPETSSPQVTIHARAE